MLSRCSLTALVLICLIANPVAAGGVRRLTLDEALQIAATQSYGVQQAEKQQQELYGRYIEERSAALPQLNATAGLSFSQDDSQRVFGPAPQQEYRYAEAGLSQPLFTWGKLGRAIHAAKVGMKTGEEAVRSARQKSREEVTIRFYDLLLAAELQRLAQQNLAQKERHLAEAEKRYALGVATDYDVLAARVSLENARPELIRSERERRAAQGNLRLALGLDSEVEAVGTLAAMPTEPSPYAEALAAALRQRPELIDLQLRSEVQKDLVEIYAAGDKPRLDLAAVAGWRNLDLDRPAFGPMTAEGATWRAGIEFSWPFFDGGRSRGQAMQARSELARLQVESQQLLDSIAVDVQQARDSMIEAAGIVQALSGTVGQAQRLLEMVEKGYEYGVKTRLDVEDAQLNLLQAEVGLARAQRDWQSARARFIRSIGEE